MCQNEPVRGVIDPRHICAVIPTFNNGGTVADVVRGVLRQGLPVIVVDDGSTDDTQERLKDLDIRVLRHETNRGRAGPSRPAWKPPGISVTGSP